MVLFVARTGFRDKADNANRVWLSRRVISPPLVCQCCDSAAKLVRSIELDLECVRGSREEESGGFFGRRGKAAEGRTVKVKRVVSQGVLREGVVVASPERLAWAEPKE